MNSRQSSGIILAGLIAAMGYDVSGTPPVRFSSRMPRFTPSRAGLPTDTNSYITRAQNRRRRKAERHRRHAAQRRLRVAA